MKTNSETIKNSLVEFLGDFPEDIKKMISVILNTLPEYLEELSTSLSNNKLKKVSDCAHKIKSTYKMLGVTNEIQTLEKLEKDALKEETEFSALEEKVDEIKTAYLGIAEILKNLLH